MLLLLVSNSSVPLLVLMLMLMQLVLLIDPEFGTLPKNYDKSIGLPIWIINAAHQIFAVSPSKVTKIGVPPLLRTESTRLLITSLVATMCSVFGLFPS